MNAPRSIAAAVAWLRTKAAAVFLRRQHETHRAVALQHAERLASEIVDVARSIEADLPELPRNHQVVALAAQAGQWRRRAEAAIAARHASARALQESVAQLHEGHWSIVNLRSELDARIAARRSGKEPVRSCKFATGSKPVRSRFSTTSSYTRPTTLE